MSKPSRKFKLLAGILPAFLIWILLAPFLAENLIVEKNLPQAEAIFILGGSSTYIERCQHAAFLFKRGIAPKIFLTNDGQQAGWDRREQRNPYFVEKARRELISQGVPENAVEILPKIVDGTKDEANLLVDIFGERKLYSVLLVTSAYHSRRTLQTFEAAAASQKDLTVEIGINPAPAGLQTPSPASWWLKPAGWKWIGGEYLKILYYWIFD